VTAVAPADRAGSVDARSPWVQRALVPALVALAVGASAAPWAGAFAIDGTALSLPVAVVGAVGLPLVAVVLGWSASRSFVASGLGLLALVVVGVSSAGGDVGEALAGLARTPARLLSETLPITGPAGSLALPVAIVWLTGATAGELSVRTSSPVGPVVPALLGYVVAHALTAGGPPAHPAWGAVLAAALLAVVGLRQAGRDEEQAHAARRATASDRATHRRLVTGLAAAVVFAVAATAVAEVAPASRPEPAAPTRAVPVVAPVLEDPIGVLAHLRERDPDAELFVVGLDGPASGYLALASLDRYDGDAWSFDRTFMPTGGRIPLEASAVPPGPDRATLSVEVGEGPALAAIPHLERPLEVVGVEVDHDPATGMLRPAQVPRPGDRFQIASATSSERAEDLVGTALLGSPVAADTTLPPDLEAHLDRVVARLEARTGEAAAPTAAFLAAVATELRTTGRRVEAGRAPDDDDAVRPTGGTSYAAVTAAVLSKRQGQPEQFATLLALVARHLGVPSRVVTGFRLRPLDSAGPVPVEAVVTPEQAWTWVEVPVEGAGWVVLDPTPLETGEAEEETFATTSTTSTTTPASANVVPDPAGGNAIADPVDIEEPVADRPWPKLLMGLGAALALVVLAVFSRAASRRLRRWHRRRRGSARQRVQGAWRELLARLRRTGLGRFDAETATEVAWAIRSRFGPEAGTAAVELAQTFNAATYTLADVTDDDAALAWAHLDAVRRAVDRQTTLPKRLAEARQRSARSRRMRHAPPAAP
jgi:transglutaminase-like putative cysteine protease